MVAAFSRMTAVVLKEERLLALQPFWCSSWVTPTMPLMAEVKFFGELAFRPEEDRTKLFMRVVKANSVGP